MEDWEVHLDNNLYRIMDKLKIKDEKRMIEIIDVLKEYDVHG